MTADGAQYIEDHEGFHAGDDTQYQCSCGEQFDSEAAAKHHLRTGALGSSPPLPPLPPHEIEWRDEIVEFYEGRVHIRPNTANHLGKVLDGASYLARTSRATYTPPELFEFEKWTPLQSGRLTLESGSPQFSPRYLKSALSWLCGSGGYCPERYTVFYRGGNALYLEGNGSGLIIAPRKQSDGE